MAIRFRCSHCRQLLSVAGRMAGRTVTCPSCSGSLVVPAPEDADTRGEADASSGKDETAPGPPDRPASETGAGMGLAESQDAAFDEYSEAGPVESSAAQTSPAPLQTAAAAAAVSADEQTDEGFSLRRPATEFDEMDLTPMVDVTFLLLIFFMITASLSLQKSIEVPAPNPDDQGASQAMQTLEDFEANSIIVEVDAQNVIFVDYERLSHAGELLDKLRDKMSLKQELVIDAHAEAFHETVIQIIDAANAVGMQKIRLASRAGQGG